MEPPCWQACILICKRKEMKQILETFVLCQNWVVGIVMFSRLCSGTNCMIKFIHNEQGNKETSRWVNWVPKEVASQCEAGWRIRGHLLLPQIILLLLSDIILPQPPEELKFPLVPHGGSLFITEHSLGWPLPEMRAPDMMPQIHLPNHQKRGSKRLVWVMRTFHFPYLVFVIKTCLLKHTFPLLSTWKIYGYCIAFHISALNSTNTQAIFLVITDDFSSNLKLSSLALTLTVSILSFYAS